MKARAGSVLNTSTTLHTVLRLYVVMPVLLSGCLAEDENSRVDYSATALTIQTVDVALEEDLQLIAEARGWTYQQSVANHQSAEAVGRVATAIARQRPDIFVGSVLSLDPQLPPTLLVKGRADDAIRDLVANEAEPIIIADEQTFSLIELQAQQQQISAALQAKNLTFSVALDLVSGLLEVSVADENAITIESVLASIPEELRTRVNLGLAEPGHFRPDTVFGGMRAWGDGACTTGWTVTDAFGQDSVTTAGHCNNVDEVVNPAEGTQDVEDGVEHMGWFGDVERHFEDDALSQPDDYYSDATTIRDVNAVEAEASISQNEQVCLYGRSSNNRNCSTTVNSVSVTCDYSCCPPMNNLVRMSAAIAIGGDSGGPWSIAGRAYGIHSGTCGGGSTWSKAALLWDALGVTVKLN